MAMIRLQGKAEKQAGIYYEIDSDSTPIGEGGMGKVYQGKCVDTRSGVVRPVAIKFMFMDLPAEAVDRARREASIRLRNDNLVEMLGFIETDENRDGQTIKHYHVVSELLHGVSLADVLQGKCTDSDGNVIPYARDLMKLHFTKPEEFAKIIIKATLSGLLALHDAGYIHRDLDPSNIFITNDRHIKILDFGIAKQIKDLNSGGKQLTIAGLFMGKPEYASPELALGDVEYQNQTTDIYAAGVMLYQCIIGKVPFTGSRFDILDKQVKQPLPLADVTDPGLRHIIAKATEKKQGLRYRSAAEMRVDLDALDMMPRQPEPASAPEPKAAPRPQYAEATESAETQSYEPEDTDDSLESTSDEKKFPIHKVVIIAAIAGIALYLGYINHSAYDSKLDKKFLEVGDSSIAEYVEPGTDTVPPTETLPQQIDTPIASPQPTPQPKPKSTIVPRKSSNPPQKKSKANDMEPPDMGPGGDMDIVRLRTKTNIN